MSCYGFLSFVVLLLCLGSNNVLCSDEETNMKEALHPFVVQCAEEFGVSEDQFEEAKNKGSVEDIDPCFMSCFMKKAEFFDSDGKLDVEKTVSFSKAHLKSEPAIKFMEVFTEECVKLNDKDVTDGDKGCERAKLMFDCLFEIKKKMGA